MMKKKNKKKMKLMGKAIIAGIIILIAVLVYFKFFYNQDEDEVVVNVLDTIDAFSYTLDDRDTLLFETEYNTLKDILSADEIDYTLYAEQISKLFVIDFYTLSNKISKYDVGALEYLNDDIEDNFKLKAEDYIYKYIGTIDEFPEVSSVVIDEINEADITFYDEEYTGYTIMLSWEYLEDYGYDESGSIEIILNGEKLEIVEFVGVN